MPPSRVLPDERTPAGLIPAVTALILALLALTVVLPALCGVWGLGGDAPVHLRWQAAFAPLVWEGHVWPRWLPGLNAQLGSPAFFFYPPMLQWLASVFLPVLPDPAQAPQRLALSLWVLSCLGAWGCHGWARAMGLSRRAALFGAALFLLWPYRAFFDIYQRAALAEAAAICVMPCLMCFASRLPSPRLAPADRTAWVGYALSVAAILYCHLPGALIGVLLATGWIVAAAWGTRDGWVLVRGASATVVGILIAAPTIAPALGLLGWLVDKTAMFGDRNDPVGWLLLSGRAWIDPAMLRMTWTLVIAGTILAALLFAIARREVSPGLRSQATVLLIAGLIVVLLNTEASHAFWALQTPLSRIQFPFRLFGAQTVILAGLGALAMHAADRHAPMLARWLWALVAAMVLIHLVLVGVQARRQSIKAMPGIHQILATDVDSSEYVLGPLQQAPQAIVAGTGAVLSRAIGYRHMTAEVNASTGLTLSVGQFAFTGWACRIDDGAWTAGGRVALSGLATCTVPAGRHRVEAQLVATAYERYGWAVAILGLVAVAFNLIASMTRRSQPRAPALSETAAR